MQPLTDQNKFVVHSYTLLVPGLVIAKKDIWGENCKLLLAVGAGEGVGSGEFKGLSIYNSEFTNLLGRNN